ncbi:PTS lactose transporter subunit IIC [Aeromicrobium phragmitis]|uniref:PTS lactose transporter subunit IIC n=1 Tax=Aeromicrobium phragmitis TaxID=2478914 RepID=A0A3L8PPU4_9ACTN|nr:fructose-specific PTS transporter subunit EIIC [Aeromicrobium phragmitis]RLV56849.1 PTS lactose transporter subunit IIC [Aeromicrobium phragmitis]
MTDLIVSDLVALDVDLGADPRSVITALAQRVEDAGRADAVGLAADALKREGQSATGLPGGIAIPHCRSAAVREASLAFARLSAPAPFGAPDGPAELVFLIAAPAEGDADHLALLSALARALVRSDFTAALRSATTPEEIVALVDEAVAPALPTPSAADESADEPTSDAVETEEASEPVSLVAVTSCPTGIAHTYMAAEALERAAREAGVELHVEPQGSSGSKRLDPETVERAGAVIFATDVGVKDKQRFVGKPVVESGVKRGIDDADGLVREALAAAADPDARTVSPVRGGTSSAGAGSDEHASFGFKLRQWLLTGVSYMIPFVAAGGLLIALGFLLAGYEVAGDAASTILQDNSLTNLPEPFEHTLFGSPLLAYLGALLFLLGSWAFSFLVPALSGYIAYAMADRPGIAPGFVVGFLANQIGAGFLGGIAGGLLAGMVAGWFTRREAPRWLAGLMPVVIIPLVTTLVVGLLMLLLIGRPIADASSALTDWLNGLSGGSALVLGAILGLMMAFDLGGPVNKAAYVFATTGLTADAIASGDATQLKIMAAVMIAGMTPPLALALSTALRPRLYTEEERENGKAAWLLGAAFISEGAIPFAAADPLRVIPSMMLGSAVAGAMAMGTGVTLAAPHGGVFVFFAVDQVLWFFVSIVAGTVVSAIAVTAAKQFGRREPAASSGATAPVNA